MRCIGAVLVMLLLAPAGLAQEWPAVSTSLPRAGGGATDVAVVVGVGRYAFLPAVPGAADNAGDWVQYLTTVRGLPAERVILLRDSEATRERLEGALTTAASLTTQSSTAWFVFIGHGAPSPGGDDGLLLGVDTQADADSLKARGLTQDRAVSLLQRGSQAHTVAVFDACFSGTTADGDRPLVGGLQATLPVRRGVRPKTTILSSSPTFAGPLPGQARPAYSYVLLGALRGWADRDADRRVTVAEAGAYTRDVLRTVLKGSDRLPSVQGPTDLILAAGVSEPGPDLDAIVLGRCPRGTRWQERRCEAVTCPADTRFDGTTCVASAVAVSCPSGSSWNGTACVVSQVACPAGASWDGSRCVAPSSPSPTSGASPPSSPLPAEAGGARTRALSEALGWTDADGDGVYDVNDKCPKEPESRDGVDDDDGCPERQVRVARSAVDVEFSTQPTFATGTARLHPAQQPAIDEVAAVLVSMASTHRFVVEGHTDNVGDPAKNRTLSLARARAVVAALVARGVPREACEAVGHGSSKPIADNSAAPGRARNRRIAIRVEPR